MQIIKKITGRSFIAGILKDKEQADKYFQAFKYPDDYIMLNKQEITQFPFYIFEKENNFEYFKDKAEVISWIKKFDIAEDDEYEYGTIFIIEEEYIRDVPDKDYMGSLDHVHLMKNEIRNIDKILSESSSPKM